MIVAKITVRPKIIQKSPGVRGFSLGVFCFQRNPLKGGFSAGDFSEGFLRCPEGFSGGDGVSPEMSNDMEFCS